MLVWDNNNIHVPSEWDLCWDKTCQPGPLVQACSISAFRGDWEFLPQVFLWRKSKAQWKGGQNPVARQWLVCSFVCVCVFVHLFLQSTCVPISLTLIAWLQQLQWTFPNINTFPTPTLIKSPNTSPQKRSTACMPKWGQMTRMDLRQG